MVVCWFGFIIFIVGRVYIRCVCLEFCRVSIDAFYRRDVVFVGAGFADSYFICVRESDRDLSVVEIMFFDFKLIVFVKFID